MPVTLSTLFCSLDRCNWAKNSSQCVPPPQKTCKRVLSTFIKNNFNPCYPYRPPCMGLRLENYLGLSAIWHEHRYLQSMSHMFSSPLTSSVKGHRIGKWHKTRVSKLRRILLLSHLFREMVRRKTTHAIPREKAKRSQQKGKRGTLGV